MDSNVWLIAAAWMRAKSTQAAGARAVEQELSRIARLEHAVRELAPDCPAAGLEPRKT